jgi:hypothetical protein
VSGLLEIRSGKVVQMQAVARGEYQMIESTELGKEGCNGSLSETSTACPCASLPTDSTAF